jgi:starch synthase
MKVLMVCAEYAPLAKTGGLADAVTGLSEALVKRGHDVRVLLPKYAHVAVPAAAVERRAGASGEFRYWEAPAGNGAPPLYLLDLGDLAATSIYTGDDRDGLRFLLLADAASALGAALDWQPDVLHCHDWHAALVPALQAVRGATPTPVVLTLHNVGYQGVFTEGLLADNGYADVLRAIDPAASAGGYVNYLRAGVRSATAITTVSPTHAQEICTAEYGMGLEDVLAARRADLTGILNGVDYSTWSPDTDPHLTEHYDAADLAPKYKLKGALCARLGLVPDPSAPLIAVVSRLVMQKGIDLVAAALPTLLGQTRASFAMLGSGEPVLTAALAAVATDNRRRVSFTNGYNEDLAHQIIAGSDLLFVPSRYEPCGLTQMYALKFGSVPVVRMTGGLADTVEHFDPVTGRGNGSVFRDADAGGLLWGTREALAWFDEPAAWTRVIANGMRADFSWQRQARPYETVYRRVQR